MARRVTLVVAFAILPQNFGKVAEIYEWYIVILSMQVDTGDTLEVVGTLKPVIAVIEFISIFWTHRLYE